jgi:hypothetical protein
VLDAGYVGLKEPSLNAAIAAQEICVTIEDAPVEANQQALQAGLAKLRARNTLEIEHKGKMKVYDSATHVPKDIKVATEDSVLQMTLILRISNQGSLRPDALIQLLWQAADLASPFAPAGTNSAGTSSGKGSDIGMYRMDRIALYMEDSDGNLHLPL